MKILIDSFHVTTTTTAAAAAAATTTLGCDS
jgi:hypothetical protein